MAQALLGILKRHVFELVDRRSMERRGLYTTAEDAWKAPSTANAHLYDVRSVVLPVVFIVKVWDDERGHEPKRVTLTYESAMRLRHQIAYAWPNKPAPQIELWEIEE